MNRTLKIIMFVTGPLSKYVYPKVCMKELFICISLILSIKLVAQPRELQTLGSRYKAGEHEKINRIGYWDSLLADARKVDAFLLTCRILNKEGIILISNQVPKAILAFEESLRIAETHNYKAEMMEPMKIMARLYSEESDKESTLYYTFKGLKIAEEIKDQESILDFYSIIAQYYLTSGETLKALETHKELLSKCRLAGYNMGIASALADIGSDYCALNQNIESVPYYLECLKYVKDFKGTIYEVQIYISAGMAYLFMEQYDSAKYYALKGYKLAKGLGHQRVIASALSVLGRVNLTIGNVKEAKEMALEAIDITSSTNFKTQFIPLYLLLRDIYLKEEDYKGALKAYESLISIRDSLSNEKVRKRAMEKEFSYNLQKKKNELRLASKQNEIQILQLSKTRYMLLGLSSALIATFILVYLFTRHRSLKTKAQQIQLEQRLLRSQMDPHFIFNSLNSIQQLIMSSKNDQAELYLSKFSKLIRQLLESSTKDDHTLAEELQMLNVYLQVESLRFKDAFLYTVNVDEQLKPGQISIPHLMVQPLIENAIWHGLLPRDGERRLTVAFEQNTVNTIKCTVDDNGIGRDSDKQRGDLLKKGSLALDFVRRRIELVRQASKITGSLDIIDKKDSNGNSLGTTAIVILPVLNYKHVKSSHN